MLNTLCDGYISNGRLLCVECRFTASQIMQRFAPLSHFSTDGLQLLTLSIHLPMKSSYCIGKYRFLHRLDAIVEAGRLSPDIDVLSILVRCIVQLLYMEQNTAIRFRKGQQLLLKLFGDGKEVTNEYISLAKRESPT